MNIFEFATRNKLRFPSTVGDLTAEDLWDLPLQTTRRAACLDDIALTLHKRLKDNETVSFVDTETRPDRSADQTAFDIVLHVIASKKADNKAAADIRDRAVRKQALLSLIAEKEGDALKGLSIDELRKQVAEL